MSENRLNRLYTNTAMEIMRHTITQSLKLSKESLGGETASGSRAPECTCSACCSVLGGRESSGLRPGAQSDSPGSNNSCGSPQWSQRQASERRASWRRSWAEYSNEPIVPSAGVGRNAWKRTIMFTNENFQNLYTLV